MKILQAGLTLLQKLIPISLAFWVSHIVLRILLLFRSDPYGLPFVSKPDWYIFHAVCLDFLWICNSLLIFLLLAIIVKFLTSPGTTKNDDSVHNRKISSNAILIILYVLFHSAILLLTFLDNEVQRFLGSHLSFGLANTYKDTSSIEMFWDYGANDYSVPYLQFFVFAFILPFTYAVYRPLYIWIAAPSDHHGVKSNVTMKKPVIAMLIFYIASFLFIHFIWTGNARMTKLKPVVSLIYSEFSPRAKNKTLTDTELALYGKSYQNLWLSIEGDSLWQFPQTDFELKNPLYRIPSEKLTQSEHLLSQRAQKPNFIVIFLESQRALNTGFLNPQLQPTPTPFFDSLAAHSRVWERMFASGLPTTGGLLSSHTGIPHHSKLAQATDLAHVSLPSFASVLSDSGYATHYFSAADPAWDNLGVWMAKWYNAQHYNRNREDDSTFFVHASSYIGDTLVRRKSPFLATLMTRSNHYPFNFAAGMSNEEKRKPLTERINYTMNYADRQLARFIRSLEHEEWFQNTYIIILADHAFPLGENGVSTMNGGAFSNATWIPFLISGKGIEAKRDTATTAQIDIAPTILELAGMAVPNIFMGHNLLRGYGSGLSLGAYSGFAAIGFDGYRLITKYPLIPGDAQWLFAESDTHQKNNMASSRPEEVESLKGILDTLIKLSDYSLERGIQNPPAK
ncbi:MAG: LTA synthase family protein [Fibrobacter sp.]|jgi:phosphoglycerol transferase MdoB-like AlkP superfamily enzyme|nr:LTA synthase family protein [Fibrobacter sp.]